MRLTCVCVYVFVSLCTIVFACVHVCVRVCVIEFGVCVCVCVCMQSCMDACCVCVCTHCCTLDNPPTRITGVDHLRLWRPKVSDLLSKDPKWRPC